MYLFVYFKQYTITKESDGTDVSANTNYNIRVCSGINTTFPFSNITVTTGKI